MNYRCNTTMLPRSQCLRVCLSCWRNVPTQLNTSTFSRNLLCSNKCGLRWNQAIYSAALRDYSNTKLDEFDISQNPYFDKYKQKLAEKQNESPEEFQSRLENLKEKKIEAVEQRKKEIEDSKKEVPKPSVESPVGAGSWPPRSLDELLKVDLIKDKTADEIRKIWSEYHAQRDCIFGIVEPINYESLVTKAESCPLFIYPLPKGDGYEYYFSQIHGKDVYFTPLGMYQLLKENAPPCLTVAHFAELADNKGIVLMAGQYDSNIISKQDAIVIVSQMSAYYNPGVGERFNLVRLFNLYPEQFKHLDIIDEYKKLKHTLPS